MGAEDHSPFGILPVELKWKIFGFLKISTKKKCRLVCFHWLVIIDENLKCKVLLNNETVMLFLSCQCHLKSFTMKNLTNSVSLSSLDMTSPRVDECVIAEGNSSQNILDILQFYSNQIDRLRIQNMALSKIKSESLSGFLRSASAEWSNLSTLSVTMGSILVSEKTDPNCKIHTQATLQILKSLKIKTLRNLTINFCRGLNFEKPWDDIFGFILNHRESLRELSLSLFGKPKPVPLPDFELFSQFGDLNLKKLSIKFDVLHASYANDLCLQIKGLDQLEIEAALDPEWYMPYHYTLDIRTFKIDEIVGLHKKTLRTLRCQFFTFDLQWLAGFDSLKNLELNVNRLATRMTPSLHGLERLSVDEKTTAESNLNYLFEFAIDQMPNLKEVEIMRSSCFHVKHLKTILKVCRWIRKIIVGQWYGCTGYAVISLKDFCRGIPGISFRIENKRHLERAVIQLNRVVTLSHNGVDYKCYQW